MRATLRHIIQPSDEQKTKWRGIVDMKVRLSNEAAYGVYPEAIVKSDINSVYWTSNPTAKLLRIVGRNLSMASSKLARNIVCCFRSRHL